MAELEEKLNNILQSPGGLDQILSAARGLLQGAEKPAEPEAPTLNIDPVMIQTVMDMMSGGAGNKNRENLVGALRPYLSKQRCDCVEKAVKSMNLAKTARSALGGFLGGGFDV